MFDRTVSSKMKIIYRTIHVVINRSSRKKEIIDAIKNALRGVCHFAIIDKSRYGWLSGLGTSWCQNKAPLLTNTFLSLSLLPSPPTTLYSASNASPTSPVIPSCTVFTTPAKPRQTICLYNRRVNCFFTPWLTRLVRDLQRACGSSRALVPVTIPLHSA